MSAGQSWRNAWLGPSLSREVTWVMAEPSMIDASVIDEALTSALGRGDAPGLVAVVAGPTGTLYSKALGVADAATGRHMEADAVFRIASMTKLATTLVALSLCDAGRLDLETPVADLVPVFSTLRVLTGFDGDRPILRPAIGVARVKHLLTHTSGLAYDTWHPMLFKYHQVTGLPNLGSGSMRCFEAPLIADPVTQFHYGTSMDWLGRVIEAVMGERLDAVFADVLFAPLSMRDSWLWVKDDDYALTRIATVHLRQADGSWSAIPADYWSPDVVNPEYLPGGHGMYSTAEDFLRLQQLVLGGGRLGDFRLVSEATIDLLFQNQIGGLEVGVIPTTDEAASKEIDLRGWRWSMGMLLAEKACPGMRTPGSAGWAGGFNTFYWIDRERSVTAALYTATLPFYDKGVIDLYEDFERAVNQAVDSAAGARG